MPHLTHGAAARRDSNLLRIRKVSLWIAGGAAAVSLGFGTAFAHALPGHHSHPATPPAGSTGARSGGAAPPTAAAGRRPQAGRGHRHLHRLAPPPQQPAPAPAQTQPVVSSGGS